MTINQKILQYIEYKGIRQRKFTMNCRLSEGTLRAGKSMGADKMIKIRRKHPDLNMNWVLFDEGEMLLDRNSIVTEPGASYGEIAFIEKELELTKALLHSKDETILLLKERLEIYQSKKNTGS